MQNVTFHRIKIAFHDLIFINKIGMYFSEGPNFLLVWGQNFASGGQIYFSGGQNFVSEVSKFC